MYVFSHTWGDDEEERVGLLISCLARQVSQTQPYDCDAFPLPRWSQFFCMYSARSVFVSSTHVESIRQGGSCVFYCKWDFYQFGSAKSLPFVIRLVTKQIYFYKEYIYVYMCTCSLLYFIHSHLPGLPSILQTARRQCFQYFCNPNGNIQISTCTCIRGAS